jgi:hypothetical protein
LLPSIVYKSSVEFTSGSILSGNSAAGNSRGDDWTRQLFLRLYDTMIVTPSRSRALKLFDGELYLLVQPNGSRWWIAVGRYSEPN